MEAGEEGGAVDPPPPPPPSAPVDEPPIIEAVTGEDDKVLTILLRAGCDSNAQNSKGESALFLASRMGFVNAVRLLMESDAELMRKDPATGRTALAEVEVLLDELRERCGGDDALQAAARASTRKGKGEGPAAVDEGLAEDLKLYRSLQVVAAVLEVGEKKLRSAQARAAEDEYLNEQYANDLMTIGAKPRVSEDDDDDDELDDDALDEKEGIVKLKKPAQKKKSASSSAWGLLKTWDFGLFVVEKEENNPHQKEMKEANEEIKSLVSERSEEWT